MKFTRTEIPDVIIAEPMVFEDERGYFAETFRLDQLEAFTGNTYNFCQDNESKSSFGVLRGLHYQLPPFAQTKLVRVIKGKVLDVAVDIRKGSPTFGKHVSVELSETDKRQLLVPRGFAHGFVVLSEAAIFSYKVDNYYSPESERGIIYNDSELNIDWKIETKDIQVSPKDQIAPSFKEADYFT
ncbi:dTDP-4-dehydrorhamnose 3,5-epimerase [Robertkochia solimangrovi]|uniref:dTDP-4-dehydrorhamnose 3,5-epimerase n=1 Tax=Robertkochia solimangrovi TaxID=2213046 RepID=UPI001180B24D|nr:dTDP-4-dehydrorhamnose 3,5-epimerase [Robertkochia solimangrovi]TRZ44968.1 dTDP-4-dehydrorhamnose 3,5-epimerase [Robertkochia solimangrovi]